MWLLSFQKLNEHEFKIQQNVSVLFFLRLQKLHFSPTFLNFRFSIPKSSSVIRNPSARFSFNVIWLVFWIKVLAFTFFFFFLFRVNMDQGCLPYFDYESFLQCESHYKKIGTVRKFEKYDIFSFSFLGRCSWEKWRFFRIQYHRRYGSFVHSFRYR